MKAEHHHAPNMARLGAAFKRHGPGCDLSAQTRSNWAIYATKPTDCRKPVARQLTRPPSLPKLMA